jgi:hypothetical protein
VKPLLLIAPAIAALTLTACGGNSSDGGSTGTQASASAASGSSTTQSGGQRGFMSDEVRACLEKHGVTLPQGGMRGGDGQSPEGYGPPGGGLPGGGEPPEGATPPDGADRGFGATMSDEDRQKLQDAMKACGVEMPARGQGGGGSQRPDINNADYQKRVNDYVDCVRENGFDLPAPDFSGDGPIFDPDKVDQSDKTFQAASAKCQSKLRPSGSGDSTVPRSSS